MNSAWTQHGPRHWEQVEKNAVMLGEHTLGCDMEVARLFALLHDCKRRNEGKDPEHGARAAEFAQELSARGLLGLDAARLATLKHAMIHHNGGQVSSDPTIGVCWDADRLDLPRVGTTSLGVRSFIKPWCQVFHYDNFKALLKKLLSGKLN